MWLRGGCGSWALPPALLQLPFPATRSRHPSPLAERQEPFKGNTVHVAAGLQQNAVLGSLLAVVLTVRRCHSGEAFVRLKVWRVQGSQQAA